MGGYIFFYRRIKLYQEIATDCGAILEMTGRRLPRAQAPSQWQGGMGMYISIGNDLAVRASSVVGIFDMDNTTTSKRTRLFLEKAQKEGLIIPCDDLPKSYVVTVEYGMTRIYESTLSASTLEKRMK